MEGNPRVGKNILQPFCRDPASIRRVGGNVSPAVFLEKAREHNPTDRMSALLTTTMRFMKETIELFARGGAQDSFRSSSGAPLNQRCSTDRRGRICEAASRALSSSAAARF